MGSRGLVAGCGIGLQTVLLAEAVDPAGHITGLDLSPGFLLDAEEIVRKSGLSKQISLGDCQTCRLSKLLKIHIKVIENPHHRS